MKTTGTLLPILGLTALGLVTSAAASAATSLDDAALLKRADLVFAGTVQSVDYAFSGTQGQGPRIPHTFVTYHIDDVIRGTAPGATITLRFIGGRGEQAAFLLASELPLFDVGDRDVLAVSGNTESGCPLVGCAAGRLRILQGHVFNDEGQAVELDANGKLALGAYYDLPEVMTHQVSQTVLTRRDHFEQGESRQPYTAQSAGTQLSEGDLLARLQGVARTLPAATRTVRNADVAQPFALEPMLAEPAPSEHPRAGAARATTPEERAEMAAMTGNGGNPVLQHAPR